MSFDRNAMPAIADYLADRGLKMIGSRSSKWKTTRCEFHDGSDSMRVNTQSGGWCCMACGVHGGDSVAYVMQADGLDFIDAARQLGCWIDDGNAPTKPFKPAGLRLADALVLVAHEALICALVATDACKGKAISETDKDRALRAAGRIQQLASEVTA